MDLPIAGHDLSISLGHSLYIYIYIYIFPECRVTTCIIYTLNPEPKIPYESLTQVQKPTGKSEKGAMQWLLPQCFSCLGSGNMPLGSGFRFLGPVFGGRA